MKKVVTVIDVDGTMVDSLEEVFKRSKEAWEEVEETAFPMDLASFRRHRWSVQTAEQYYQNAKLFQNGTALPEEFSELELLRKKIDASSFVTKFYEARKKAMQDRSAWFGEHRLFDGVPEMFQHLEDIDVINTAVTTKDRESTKELLGHFKIDRYLQTIYAREESKESAERAYQFKKLLKDYDVSPSDVIAYDDLADQLVIAKNFGFLSVAAPQGYSRDKDLATYIKARPREFASIVVSVVKGERK
jgi:phosphoglycolate phosphatase-like HAD superfamily hydrolase